MNDSYDRVADDEGETKQALAANLRRLRVAHHVSLSQLARTTGVSKATLSGIERGGANPTVETLAALASELGVTIGELLEQPELAPVYIIRREQGSAGRRQERSLRALGDLGLGGDYQVAELSLPSHHVEQLAPRAAGSRTLIYVIQGNPIAGPAERTSELAAGDYASLPADAPHQVETGVRPAKVLLLTRTPR